MSATLNTRTELTPANVAAVHIPPPSEIGTAAYQFAYRKRAQVLDLLATLSHSGLAVDLADMSVLGYAQLAALRVELRDRIRVARYAEGLRKRRNTARPA